MAKPIYKASEISLFENELSLSLSELHEYTLDITSLYYRFSISKGNNKKRWINAPKDELKNVQNILLHKIFYRASVHPCAHGFVPKRSIVTNARLHLKQNWVINFDIHAFFPSTKMALVYNTIERYFDFSPDLTQLLTSLCTKDGELPQGAPTSPHLANLVMWNTDIILQGYAERNRLVYTRYADDLTFSGAQVPQDIQHDIQNILASFGYRLARHKSKILGQHKRQMVTGLVVNEKLNLPRPTRKRLRAILHDIKKSGFQEAISRSKMNLDQIIGRISLQAMWDRDAANDQIMELAHALNLLPPEHSS
jgi:RNA-directed DNA polymerase